MNDNARRTFLTTTVVGMFAANTDADQQGEPDVNASVEKAVSEARRAAADERMQEQAAYGKALVARFGASVVDVIKDTTIARTRAELASANVQKRDLQSVKSLLWDRMGERFAFQVVEHSPRLMKFKVTRCPLAERMRQLDAADLGFAYYCAYDYGFCQGLNPAIKFTRTKTLMQGCDCCDHTYELEP